MTEILQDASSDYGDITSDEQEIIDELLATIPIAGAIAEEPLAVTDIEDYEEPRGLRLPKTLGKEGWSPSWMWQQPPPPQPPQQVAADGPGLEDHRTAVRNVRATTVDVTAEAKRSDRSLPASTEALPDLSKPDMRSPMARFRTKPKKALSVTDLVSPAWCELQYFYALSKHGRIRKTPAMQQGSKVHKARESAVHITVPVSTTTKEDSWGLRIWNIIQGLRTLRETGKTRELEVWGIVDGEVVNGVIDELSYQCPVDSATEAAAVGQTPYVDEQTKVEEQKSTSQGSITDYYRSAVNGANGKTIGQLGTSLENAIDTPTPPLDKGQDAEGENARKSADANRSAKQIYLTEIKTRRVKQLPRPMTFAPTAMQMQLYYWMLESLTRGQVPLQTLVDRYDLDPHLPFSDSFIAEVGGLNDQFYDAVTWQLPEAAAAPPSATDWSTTQSSEFQQQPPPTPPLPPSSQDSIDMLLNHNTLTTLWDLMLYNFRQTFLPPPPPPTPNSPITSPLPPPPPLLLSPLLTATYIHPTTHTHLGQKTLLFSRPQLAEYIQDEMAWWKGQRPTMGVKGGVDEVSVKCASCDFRDECSWLDGLRRRRTQSEMEMEMDKERKGQREK